MGPSLTIIKYFFSDFFFALFIFQLFFSWFIFVIFFLYFTFFSVCMPLCRCDYFVFLYVFMSLSFHVSTGVHAFVPKNVLIYLSSRPNQILDETSVSFCVPAVCVEVL